MKRVVPLVALAAFSQLSASADVLWHQDPINHFGGLASQDARNPGGLGFFAETVDNFTGQAGWTIQGLEFWGGYPQVEPGHTHGFMIRFYSDNNGQVGSLLTSQDVTTFTETVYYVWPPPLNFPGYHYTLNLNTPLAIPSTGLYWVAVVAILDRGGNPPANEPQWGWIQSQTTTPPTCVQSFFAPGVYTPQPQDVSFVLNGTTGSEPTCYANCDGSTVAPVLTVADFGCFLNAFAAGCS